MELEYDMEELLPILIKLTEKYTSNESSSVSYGTAAMLMEGMIYTIKECLTGNNTLSTENKLTPESAYQRGYNIIVKKVYKSKEIYEDIIKDFEDYGCRNYKDTILKGFPVFYLKYDPRFCPQDHLLTLDYPSLKRREMLKGIDRIYCYLCDIRTEQRFLNNFGKEEIKKLLDKITITYKEDYFDNLCYPVLLTGIGCIIADKPVYLLNLNEKDMCAIEDYFMNDTLNKIEQKIRSIIHLILNRTSNNKEAEHFLMLSSDYAVRIKNSLSHASLNGIFYIN